MLHAGKSHIGMVRKVNQDNFVIEKVPNSKYYFSLVADGMGGHKAGEYASKEASSFIKEYVMKELLKDDSNPMLILEEAVKGANSHVYNLSKNSADSEGMGTTVVACILDDNKIYVANVGDSRLYTLKDNNLSCVTIDHSFVNELLRLGKITKEEAENHPNKNVITRAVGYSENVDVDIFVHAFSDGDKILLCSDGLTNMVSEETIKNIMIENDNPVDSVEKLISLANENGGDDNITVVIIDRVG